MRDSPWFAGLGAVVLDGWALYVLVTGEVKLSRYRPDVYLARASDPGAFWAAWLLIAVLAALLSLHAWRLWQRR